MDVWSLCQEITSKQEWYSKVFNDDIVNQWYQEVLDKKEWFLTKPSETSGFFGEDYVRFNGKFPNVEDLFWFVIKLLRSTAQGSSHRDNCEWDEGVSMCRDCMYNLKQDILNNPGNYSLESEDIDSEFFNEGWVEEYQHEINCEHPRCNCLPPDSNLENYVNYHPNGLISQTLHNECKRIIAHMSQREPIDWHPGSDQQVRDLIHPSMYCYVKGVSAHY